MLERKPSGFSVRYFWIDVGRKAMPEPTSENEYERRRHPEGTRFERSEGMSIGPEEALSKATLDKQDLLEGFTPQEITNLMRTRQAVAQGRLSEITAESKRLLFARWLVAHGRLDG